MSAIDGVHRYYGAPVAPRWLEPMKAARTHHSPCECPRSSKSVPYAREALDLPLFNRCLARIAAKADPCTTRRVRTVLARALGVRLFLRRLAGSHSWGFRSPC